jgi:1-acyl-sn-glycerol-3-phosphate acyltransferase
LSVASQCEYCYLPQAAKPAIIMKNQAAAYSRGENDLPVQMLRSLNRVFCRVYHRLEVRTPCPLPRQGPAILACNHLSGLDPLLVQSTTRRLIRWLMAREYYEHKALRWMLDIVGTIPVERSGRDMAATRAALAALKAGYVLGVFPEGKIETSRELLPFQAGIGLLAVKSGVPVYPAYLDGTQRGKEIAPAILQSNCAILTFGEPRQFRRVAGSHLNMDEATKLIENDVNNLRIMTLNRPIFQQ